MVNIINKKDKNPLSMEKIYDAYLKCRKNKRSTLNALKFELSLLDNIVNLYDELNNNTYHPSSSICFVQKKPKLREIFAADFRDRVVHHLLVGYLEPEFERIFIHDSYSCRKNKGIHGAVTKLQRFLHKVTSNGCKPAWYLKEDIRGFFMNIDQHILYEMICSKFKQKQILNLAKKIIFSRCIDNYHFKGDPSILDKIPPHKTLFKVGQGKGLPIGNLTSQFFANVYLNELDHYVKRQLKCKYYIRYCDDFILLSDCHDQLQEWHEQMKDFIKKRLFLELNMSQFKLRSVSSGIDFLGYVIRRRYTLIRRRVVNNCKQKLLFFNKKLAVYDKRQVIRWNYAPDEMEKFRSTVVSYLGHLKWADTYNLKKFLFIKYPVLRVSFILNDYTLIPRYLPAKQDTKFRNSYNWWAPDPDMRSYKKSFIVYPLWICGRKGNVKLLLFFQVGCFFEFYDSQALLAHKVLNLKLVNGLHGFKLGCGFHRRVLSLYINKSLNMGFHVVLIRETKRADCSVFRRVTALIRAKSGISRLQSKVKKTVQMEFPF